ncbi:DinB family protein [Ornithinibacillus salinisoli]|uniref:DinB family protein n=1 Tax=Ornithinibacillus salinisoli TaxID=1848459 RepID=A0ABW4W1M3_9BACI
MVHVNDILADQFLANANDPSFYLPFSKAVENILEEEAFWKPNEDCHSIAEITQHLLYWNETWQTRYENSDVQSVAPLADNEDSFIIPKDLSFEALKGRMLEVLLKWQTLLTEEQVESDVKGYPADAQWWELLGNVMTHNAYHIGQIIYVRKLQKSWYKR